MPDRPFGAAPDLDVAELAAADQPDLPEAEPIPHNVIELGSRLPAAEPDAAATSTGEVVMVSVVGYGGLVLRRAIAICEPDGRVLFSSAVQVGSEEEAAATFRRLCEILAGCYDEDAGDYHLTRLSIDEQGKRVPGSTS